MTRTTQQVRDAWAPPCQSKLSSLLGAYAALDDVFKSHGYRPRAGVTGAFNCRRITGGSGYSLHAYGPGAVFTFWTSVAVTTAVAVDVNWDKNPYGPRLITDMPRAMIDDVYKIRTVDGVQVWRWGGYYSRNKDAMHFEVVASPAELARGIAGHPTQEALVVTPEDEKKIRDIVKDELLRSSVLLFERVKNGAKEKVGVDVGIKALLVKAGVMDADGTWNG